MRRGLDGEVLRVLRDAGPQTKNQLAHVLVIPRTTLNASVRGLADAGHVEDGSVAASSGGRRSVTVRIACGRRFLVLSMGEAAARVAVLDGQLTVTSGVNIDLQDRDPETEWLRACTRARPERTSCRRRRGRSRWLSARGCRASGADLKLLDGWPS